MSELDKAQLLANLQAWLEQLQSLEAATERVTVDLSGVDAPDLQAVVAMVSREVREAFEVTEAARAYALK